MHGPGSFRFELFIESAVSDVGTARTFVPLLKVIWLDTHNCEQCVPGWIPHLGSCLVEEVASMVTMVVKESQDVSVTSGGLLIWNCWILLEVTVPMLMI